MKILNIVLSVLVLIMAAASAAAAFMLFQKRALIVDGWSKLTTAIHQTAEIMDRNSGTNVARDLSAEALAHANYESLDPVLGKLKTQAQQLVAERDALAESVRRIGQAVGAKNLPKLAELTGIATSKAATDDIINGVGDFKNRRDAVINQVVNISRKVNAQINANELRNGNVSSINNAFRSLDNRITAIRGQFSKYEANARSVGSVTGASGLNFSESAYQNSLNKVLTSAKTMKSNLDSTKSNLSKTQKELASAQNTIRQRNGQIETLKSTIARKDTNIKELRKALGLEPTEELKLWDAGSPEAQRMVMGKVIEINRKFGFIAINLGKNTIVKQPVGKKLLDVNPMLAPGMTMLVAANANSPDVKYIGKIKLVTVDSDCSIAECIDLSPDEKIAVGNDVFFPSFNGLPAKK